jgi:hypothetical protein
MHALLLSFAQEEDESIIFGPPKLLSQTELSDRCDEIRTWLKSRCAGLLEARSLASRASSRGPEEPAVAPAQRVVPWPDPPWVVSYIHRSARDFIEQDHIWASITNPTVRTGFHPLHAWTRAWILYLKRIKPTSEIQKRYGTSLGRIAVEAAEKDATPLPTWCYWPHGEDVERQIAATHKEELLKTIAFWLIDSETFQSQKFGPYVEITDRIPYYRNTRSTRIKRLLPSRHFGHPYQAINSREATSIPWYVPMDVPVNTVSN